jgi:hypothetical protein
LRRSARQTNTLHDHAVQKWAADYLRSLNAQIEYVLRDALQRAGRSSGARKKDGPYR